MQNKDKEKNKVLIVSMNKYWMGISRFPSALHRAGFETYALCPKGSYLSYTKYLNDAVIYPIFTYTRSRIFYFHILHSIIKFKPELIIPGDEDALAALLNLSNFLSKTRWFSPIASVIRKSLVKKEFDELVLSKSRFIEKCVEWKIRVPQNIIVTSIEQALKAAEQLGLPLVVKCDGGYGGSGVFICHTTKELTESFNRAAGHSFVKKIKRFFKNLFFITPKNELNISLQQFISGLTGHITFCSYRGNFFASNPMLKLKTYPESTGPTSVSCGFNNPEIEHFARTVAQNLSYTGFGALDFIVDKESNSVYVIELNPRPTPSCHFGAKLVAYDLCEVFFKAIKGKEHDWKSYKDFTVAMFPNEKKRDPLSPYLTEAYHDVPYDDPKLLKVLSQ